MNIVNWNSFERIVYSKSKKKTFFLTIHVAEEYVYIMNG